MKSIKVSWSCIVLYGESPNVKISQSRIPNDQTSWKIIKIKFKSKPGNLAFPDTRKKFELGTVLLINEILRDKNEYIQLCNIYTVPCKKVAGVKGTKIKKI